MKKYTCPNCGCEKWIRPANCPDCGEPIEPSSWNVEELDTPPTPHNPKYVTLNGDTGHPLTYRRQPYPMEYGRQILISASTEAKYAGRGQFILKWDGDSCLISPGTNPANVTIINSRPLEGSQKLQFGDIIQLQGKSSGKVAMELLVLFDE